GCSSTPLVVGGRVQRSTSTPMLRAVPAMVRAAASRSLVFMSSILTLAISSTWSQLSLPTLSLFGSFEPEPGLPVVARPQAFFTRMLAGGDFITNEYDLSA